jgi:hypothetical protein
VARRRARTTGGVEQRVEHARSESHRTCVCRRPRDALQGVEHVSVVLAGVACSRHGRIGAQQTLDGPDGAPSPGLGLYRDIANRLGRRLAASRGKSHSYLHGHTFQFSNVTKSRCRSRNWRDTDGQPQRAGRRSPAATPNVYTTHIGIYTRECVRCQHRASRPTTTGTCAMPA